jgi:hypothetical protein
LRQRYLLSRKIAIQLADRNSRFLRDLGAAGAVKTLVYKELAGSLYRAVATRVRLVPWCSATKIRVVHSILVPARVDARSNPVVPERE